MPRYFYMLHTRLDPIAYNALVALARSWEVYNDKGNINLSETVRRAIVYSYLVYVEGIDPARASTEIEPYIEQKLVELGIATPREIQRMKRGKIKKFRKKIRFDQLVAYHK